MVSGKGAEAKFCVSTDKGRKQAERWGQHVTPGPQAWAAAAVMARIMALFVLPVNSPEKKGFQGLLLLFAQRWLPEAPLRGPSMDGIWGALRLLHCLVPPRYAEARSQHDEPESLQEAKRWV